ncbi:MAG TPA: glycerophosphodiester phosphodiesterase family protein [Acetobacteraceae bacterium]|nr:glycerophosphodiester phosphodiesterase family protein [Acetobacteraceae bacterium]
MICIGHRGAMGHAPENTLASVEKAIALGAPWVEIDVYHVDGHLMVIHDDRLERTTNGSGYVTGQSHAYLRSLDAGNGEKIPTLDEVFDLVGRRAGINVELKGPDTARPVMELIAERLRQGWSREEILISSFNHRELRNARSIDPAIRTGALIVGLPLTNAAFASELGAYSVHPSLEFIDREFVEDAHRRGLKVFVFTVNHPEDIARMAALGVDGLFTNYPDRVPVPARG